MNLKRLLMFLFPLIESKWKQAEWNRFRWNAAHEDTHLWINSIRFALSFRIKVKSYILLLHLIFLSSLLLYFLSNSRCAFLCLLSNGFFSSILLYTPAFRRVLYMVDLCTSAPELSIPSKHFGFWFLVNWVFQIIESYFYFSDVWWNDPYQNKHSSPSFH